MVWRTIQDFPPLRNLAQVLAAMASVLSYLNRLLPFATPGTPLLQDLIHLAAICGALYYAPQIQEWYQQRRAQNDGTRPEQALPDTQDVPNDHDTAIADGNHQDQAPQPDIAPHHEAGDDAQDDEEDAHDAPRDNDFNENDAAQPGPARIPDMPPARNVGAKKAKALAKKDQRRAYHEFQRSQGEAQRARDAEGAAERDAELAAERERRRAAEAKVKEREAREREVKRESERKARADEMRRREMVVRIVREEVEGNGVCELMKVARQAGNDVDEEWVEKIVHASGILGRKGDATTMTTSLGWVVRVTESDMAEVYRRAVKDGVADGDSGAVSYDTLGRMLQEVIVQR